MTQASNDVLKARSLAPDLPWNQAKFQDLGPCIMKYMEDHEPFYRRWIEAWMNIYQFIHGNQTMRWSRRFGYIDTSNFTDFKSKAPSVRQRAQTNLAKIVFESLSSMIYANLPEWDADACDESSIKSKRTKRIIQKLLDAYMIRLCADVEIGNAARIYTATGQVSFKIDWNKRGGHLIEVPRWNKNNAPVMTDFMAPNPALGGQIDVPTQALDSMGSLLFENRFEPVLDAMGKQIIDKFFAGDVYLRALTPMQLRRNIGSTGMHDAKAIQEIRLIDYDQWLDEYGPMDGRTPLYDRVQPIFSNSVIYKLALRYFMQMQFTTPPPADGDEAFRGGNAYRASMFKNKVLVIEHYDAPHPEKWKLGRKVVVSNGDVTHITTPTYNTGKLDGWHPYVEAQWLNLAPSSIAIGPMLDVVSKNKELNIADALIATALRRNMGSQLLIKPGVGLDPQRLTGEPGMTHEVMDPFAARWLHDDMPLPAVLPTLRQSYKDDVYDVSGAGEALRGERSPGAPSGYAQRIIEEREERRLSSPSKSFEKALGGAGEKLITCLQANVVQLDQGVMGFLIRAAAGEFTPNDVIAFLSSPISFGTEVRVEADSMHLRSKATQQATINDMATGNPAVQQRLQSNPKALDEYLKYFDAETLRDDSADHRDRAQRENEQFMDMMRLGPQGMQGGIPVVVQFDNDPIHIQEHQSFFVQHAEEIMRNKAFFNMFLQHYNRHVIKQAETQNQAPPGANLQAPQLTQQASAQAKPPQVAQIMASTRAKQQQQAVAATQAAQGAQRGRGAPGPKQPAMMGSGGPPQTGAQTPAANTPMGGLP